MPKFPNRIGIALGLNKKGKVEAVSVESNFDKLGQEAEAAINSGKYEEIRVIKFPTYQKRYRAPVPESSDEARAVSPSTPTDKDPAEPARESTPGNKKADSKSKAKAESGESAN